MSGNEKSDRRREPNWELIRLCTNAGLSPNALSHELNGAVSAPSIRLAQKGHVPGPRIQHTLATYFGVRPTDIWKLPGGVKEVVSA